MSSIAMFIRELLLLCDEIEASSEFELMLDDCVVNLRSGLATERWTSNHHFVDKNAQTPPIDSLVVSLVRERFGC